MTMVLLGAVLCKPGGRNYQNAALPNPFGWGYGADWFRVSAGAGLPVPARITIHHELSNFAPIYW